MQVKLTSLLAEPQLARGRHVYWQAPGKLVVQDGQWDAQLLKHSQLYGTELLDAMFLPIGDITCPTNELSGSNGFPARGRRAFDARSRPGHETVGLLVAATPKALQRFAARGVTLGDFGVVNINLGCGICVNCQNQASPDVCQLGQTYIGLGDSRSSQDQSDSWVKRETGVYEIPGFLAEFAAPIHSGSFYKIPSPLNELSAAEIFAFALADGVGCVRNAIDSLGITMDFPRYYRRDNPELLIVGAGKLGLLAALVAKDQMPNCVITAVDIKAENLAILRDGVKGAKTHLLKTPANTFGEIQALANQALGGKFNYIIITAPHAQYDGTLIKRLGEATLARRGRTTRLDHTPTTGLDAGAEVSVERQIIHASALGPADNFSYAMGLIQKHAQFLGRSIEIVDDPFAGDSPKVVEITETSGTKLKAQSDCTSFCLRIHPIEPLRQLISHGKRYDIIL